MTQPATPPAQPPAAPAAAPPAPAAPPAAPAAEAEAGPLTPEEETLLGELLEKRAAGAAGEGAIRMKVEPPHAALTHGGITIGTEFTTVPGPMVAAMTTAAADAGVKITQET
jgi:hypothetical protein